MINPNELYVILVWSDYADCMIPEGLAYGKDEAWEIAESFHKKLYSGALGRVERVDTDKSCGFWYGHYMNIQIKRASDHFIKTNLNGMTNEHPTG